MIFKIVPLDSCTTVNSPGPGHLLFCCFKGGLPTFLDVGKSFSASAIVEDNLIHQLKVRGDKLVSKAFALTPSFG